MQRKTFHLLVCALCLIPDLMATDVFRMSIDLDLDLDLKNAGAAYPQETSNGKGTAAPTFSFAKHFQNHMVLQQAPARANIYGFSPDIGQKVIMQVTTSSKQFYYTTIVQQGPAPDVGVWLFTLDPMDSSVVATIKVMSEQGYLSLNDVLFGDVWLCSGQSNMQFTVSQMDGAEDEMNDAHNYPNIRLMTVAEATSATPLYDLQEIQQAWTQPSHDSIGGPAWTYFSAVCWLYGKAIHKALGYPIGLVATDWGGTPVEAWSSTEALAKCGVTSSTGEKEASPINSYMEKLSQEDQANLRGPQDNSVLWNAMIHPLLNMTIYGAIWYQGEADAQGDRMNHYNCTFPTMIKDWRQKFNQASQEQTSDSFPFGFVQLAANADDPTISVGFPDIRWHQTADRGYVPNPDMPKVFMAVAMDLPDFQSAYGAIHPQDKKDVGDRLSLSGLGVAYGHMGLYQGPYPTRATGSSSSIVVDYGHGWTLNIKDYDGFELLCTVDSGLQTTKWVPTSIIASNTTTVSIYANVCGGLQNVKGLRYAWRESPCAFKQCAVYETLHDLPGPPFVAYAEKRQDRELVLNFQGPTHI